MASLPHLVAVLGHGVASPDEPVLTADDLGVTRGDGCFDTARVVTDAAGTAEVVSLAEHLSRLAASARSLDIPCPQESEWRALVAESLAAWHHPGEAVLKLVLTRGREWVPGPPTALLTITYRPDRPTDAAPAAISAVRLSRGHPADGYADAPWLLGGVKTLSYAVNAAAQREARARGADDVVFTSTDGFALDGPTSGLLVARDGALLSTPPGRTGILRSVTIDTILDAARRAGREAHYRLVPASDLDTAEGVWLVSAGRGPAPVHTLDGRPLPLDPRLVAEVASYAGFGRR